MNLPTKLTVMRIVLIPVFIILFFIQYAFPQYPYFRFCAVAVFIIASFTDFLDGHIARKYNLVTNLGKFLDPIADKMLVSCALIAIALDGHAFRIGVAVCSMIILCRELLVSGFRIIAASRNLVLAADKLGKIKTVLQMISLILLVPYANIAALNQLAGNIFLYTGLILLALATVMTIVSGANYIIKNKEVLKD